MSPCPGAAVPGLERGRRRNPRRGTRDQLGIPRQHIDRDGPGRLRFTSDDHQPVPAGAVGEPAREHSEIIAQAVEIVGREPGPLGLTPDLLHRRRGNAGKGSRIVPIGQVGRHRGKRNVARHQNQLGEHRRRGAERRVVPALRLVNCPDFRPRRAGAGTPPTRRPSSAISASARPGGSPVRTSMCSTYCAGAVSAEPFAIDEAVKCELAHLRRRSDASPFLNSRGRKHHPSHPAGYPPGEPFAAELRAPTAEVRPRAPRSRTHQGEGSQQRHHARPATTRAPPHTRQLLDRQHIPIDNTLCICYFGN
jgi:hypothetical protein